MAEASSQSNLPTLAEELGSIAARAQTYTGASGSAIALSEGSADEMICRACSGPSAPDIGASIRLEGTFTGMAVQSGQALRCDDSDTDKRVDAAACRALGTRSIVVVPIRDADTEVVMGVLAVFAGSKNAFNDLHVAVLRTMAREVAVSVQKWKKVGVTLSTMSIPVYVDPPTPPARPSNPGFTPPVAKAPAPKVVPTPPPMPAPTATAAAPKPAPIAEPAPTMMAPAPRAVTPMPPPPPPPVKLAPPVPPPTKKEDPLQPMAAPIQPAKKAATMPATPEWKPAPPPPLRKVETPAEPSKPEAPRAVSFGTFDSVAADKKPGGSGMMIWIGVAAALVLIIGGYFAYNHFSGGPPQPQPQSQATQSQPQEPPAAASTPVPAAASPTPTAATQASPTPTVQAAAAQPASKPAATPPQPAPQPATKPVEQNKLQPQQQVVARELSTPTPAATAPRQIDLPKALPAQTPQVAVPITTSAPTLAAARVSQTTQAQLVSQVAPKYPPMARTMHAGGDVVLQATVGKDGTVKAVKVISGHPLLRDAASSAVKQWHYKPATLNGEPVETTTQVIVKFGNPQ